MKQLIAKKLSKVAVALLVAVAVLAPIRALAFTVNDLLIAYDQTSKLCNAGDKGWCSRRSTYSIYISNYNNASSASAKQAVIDGMDPKFTGQYYNEAKAAYQQLQSDGTLPGAGAGGSDPTAPIGTTSGNCGDDSVEVSIAVSGNDKCVGDSDNNPIYVYLRGIILFLGGAIGLAVVISIIVAGIQYSSSNGNPQNIAKAKERLINAVIGLVLYLFLAAILRYLVPQIFT